MSRPGPDILPFALEIRPGVPVFEQLIYAVRKAAAAGLIRPGDPFPSVRTIGRELRIHPNTVQKALSVLVQEGLLEVHPGIGTVVAIRPLPAPDQTRQLLAEDIERLIVEARSAGLSLEDLKRLLTEQWKKLSPPRSS
jgi:Predicted transcriptional regulators